MKFKSLSAKLQREGKIVDSELRQDKRKRKLEAMYLREEDWEYLKEVSKSYDIPNRALLKIILEDFVKKHKKCSYLFERFGI